MTPRKLSPAHLTCLIDTREQRPLDVRPMRAEWATLQSADYTIKGLDGRIGIERKSFPDFLACVGTQRDRFERELHRLRGFEYAAVVVEANFSEVLAGEWRNRLSVDQVFSSVVGFSRHIPIYFTGDRVITARWVRTFLFLSARERLREIWPLVKEVKGG